MPDYSQLRKLMSHRVRIDYDSGASITGYVASCTPGSGPVEFVSLSKAELLLSDGSVCEAHDEISVPANVLTSFALDEGPRGRDA